MKRARPRYSSTGAPIHQSASMLKPMWMQAAVQERGGDQPPPVAVRDERPEEHPLDVERAARGVEPAALHRGDEVDRRR